MCQRRRRLVAAGSIRLAIESLATWIVGMMMKRVEQQSASPDDRSHSAR
jgi:hypothetical protein